MNTLDHAPDDRPDPLVPAEVDLRDYMFMPLEGERLRNSRTWVSAATDPHVAYACINLWWVAWHEVPAGSLPGSRSDVGRMSGVSPKVWKRIANRVLDGWIGPCTDGRFYHPVVCEKALEAWAKKKKQRQRTRAATLAAAARRQGDRNGPPDDDRNGLRNGPKSASVTDSVTESKGREGKKESPVLSRERTGRVGRAASGSNGSAPDPQKALFDLGKSILGQNAGGLIRRLLDARGGNVELATAALWMAKAKQNPREYIGAIVNKRERDDNDPTYHIPL